MSLRIVSTVAYTSLIALFANGVMAQQTPPSGPVGQAPPQEEVPEQAVAILDERGVLTPKGTLIIEPSFQYIHSTSLQVAIEGFTIIPAIGIGLINVEQTQRDTLIGALAFRYGLTNRLEIGAKVPYVYKEENVRAREILRPTEVLIIADSDGHGLGDVEFALHYQLNRGLGGWPFMVGNVRVKTRTGKDPFEVDRREFFTEEGVLFAEIFEEQPTGSGFWAVQPSLTFIFPTDPAVLFGNVSYLWNVKRDVGPGFGEVDPGDAIGFNFGIGFAVNDRTSFSLGYDHSTVFKTKIERDPGLEPEFDRLQVGSLLVGISHRIGSGRWWGTNLNVSLGVGATDAAPDVQLTVRAPFSF